ncbi:putative Pre-mRNA-splicing factor prp5 [Blattamonas nauphoetae]|uniref:Pre-mRNA-splicing factor prp5 n=1 Tax=Blattamonas nauphoetae TaxID=2049346 RepID=A0ABQ9XIA5_9EUKA|nr:putative Pre-mRNA-splicing factor prp5 [Blattamonas nauphoetae]
MTSLSTYLQRADFDASDASRALFAQNIRKNRRPTNLIPGNKLMEIRTRQDYPSVSQQTPEQAQLPLPLQAPLPDSSLSLIHIPKETAIIPQRQRQTPPVFHQHWKLVRVIAGHTGWVRSISVEPKNEWFCTGSNDQTVKIWNMHSNTLRLTLTGHTAAVRAVTVSDRSPYIFSCGEDKQILCWDLEQNKVTRKFHGHLSGVYALALHPSQDILISGGIDSMVYVWDIRTKFAVMTLGGHSNAITSLHAQNNDPQIVSGSEDTTIRLWDLRSQSTFHTFTHHKKGVRSLAAHPFQFTFASGGADNVKKYAFTDTQYLGNIDPIHSIVNSLCIRGELESDRETNTRRAGGILVGGCDNGDIGFWDWRTGYLFQTLRSPVQPGSLDVEAGIYATQFDKTGNTLISAHADKTIRVYIENEESTPEVHPVQWTPKEAHFTRR